MTTIQVPGKRNQAFERKYRAAWQGIEFLFDNTEHNFYWRPKKDAVEVQTFFDYEGGRMRFDYSWSTDGTLPRVGILRQLIWDSLKVYRHSLVIQ